MKKCNKFISAIIGVLMLFTLFCGSISVSAETTETTTDIYFQDMTTCTCAEHMGFYTTKAPSTTAAPFLNEEDQEKANEIGEDLKAGTSFFHNIIAMFNDFFTAILNILENFSGNISLFG